MAVVSPLRLDVIHSRPPASIPADDARLGDTAATSPQDSRRRGGGCLQPSLLTAERRGCKRRRAVTEMVPSDAAEPGEERGGDGGSTSAKHKREPQQHGAPSHCDADDVPMAPEQTRQTARRRGITTLAAREIARDAGDSALPSQADDPGQLMSLMLANAFSKARDDGVVLSTANTAPRFRCPLMAGFPGPPRLQLPATFAFGAGAAAFGARRAGFAAAGENNAAVAGPLLPPPMLFPPPPAHSARQSTLFRHCVLPHPMAAALFNHWVNGVAFTDAVNKGITGGSRGFSCTICRRTFPTVHALGGHKTMHRKHTSSRSSSKNGGSSSKNGGSNLNGSSSLLSRRLKPAPTSPQRGYKRFKVADDSSAAKTDDARQNSSKSPPAADISATEAAPPTPPFTPTKEDAVPVSWPQAGAALDPAGENAGEIPSPEGPGVNGGACDGLVRAQLKRAIKERLLQTRLVQRAQGGGMLSEPPRVESDARDEGSSGIASGKGGADIAGCELSAGVLAAMRIGVTADLNCLPKVVVAKGIEMEDADFELHGFDACFDKPKSPGSPQEGHGSQDCFTRSVSRSASYKFKSAAHMRTRTVAATSAGTGINMAWEDLKMGVRECPMGSLDLTLRL
ncbi:hypothetical protein CLOM_g23800 [Closterium sp. NIES-68]|nr:hypothetical protein CLOM_g23800 [Closterium sp. NIES-68]GJP76050.1 hypothetical protein CLOP_g6441 [Closterium sp. NIES-67]